MTQNAGQQDPCKNACTDKLLFPGTPFNRPGLDHIGYRIGAYPDIRQYLLRKLDLDPVLAPWTHREPDDPGIALLESAAVVGDILTFYQELYANEAYIRTAQWRESIAHLVRLTGYRLSPGVGGSATFAIEIKDDKNKSGKSVTIPKGFLFKAQVTGLEKAADFETSSALTAYPALSKFNLYSPGYHPPIKKGTAVFSTDTANLERMGLKLKKGDRLILAPSPVKFLTPRQSAVVADVSQRFNRTTITLEGSWQGNTIGFGKTITAYKIKRTFKRFGFNAPPTKIVVSKGLAKEENITFQQKTGTLKYVPVNPGPAVPVLAMDLDPFLLDREVKDISPGATMLVDIRDTTSTDMFIMERKALKTYTATAQLGALSGSTTRVELNRSPHAYSYSLDIHWDTRLIELHEVEGAGFTLTPPLKEISILGGFVLMHYGDAKSYLQLHQRRLILEKPGGSVMETTGVTFPVFTKFGPTQTFRPLVLITPLEKDFAITDFPLENPTITVYGNITDATQGKTEKEEVVGNGDQRQKFQSFKLPKAPLTYHNQSGASPPEVPELQIYVNNRLWTRVDVFFGHGPKEEIYIVREDDQNNSWVQFGDGKSGARLPSGIRNISAVYRTGTGAYGALKDGTNPQAGGKAERLGKVFMPGPSSGGDEPEEGDNAREAAPGKTQTLGRLVSLKDFESEALAIPGVSRAAAALDVSEQETALTLTLLMETGRGKEFDNVKSILNGYNRCRGPQRFPVETCQGQRKYVYLHAQFGLDPAYKEDIVKTEIKKALGVSGEEANNIDGRDGLFGSRQRRFGQHAYVSRIEGVINNVAGVLWANVKLLWPMGTADDPATLPSGFKVPPIDFTPITVKLSCGQDQVLCLYKNHLQLSAAKDETAGRC